jgi:hypothetical protein
MNSALIKLFLIIGGTFGVLAALMSYLITYKEYIRHYPNSQKPRKLALEAAIFTFVFFFLLALAGGYIIVKYIE